jgi:hypothetical protein
MNLWEYFQNNTGKKITKWTHYFPIYEKHFKPLTEKPIKLLEIGVLNGGSLEMWRKYFHPDSTIVGIDINPDCKQHEQEGIHVRIGSQVDTDFLQSVIDEFGVFDLVIDDGSHRVEHVNRTFEFLYPKIAEDGTYFIEDTHAAYWGSHGGSISAPESINNVAKRKIDELNAYHVRGDLQPTEFTRITKCMSCYDSIIVFEKGDLGERLPMEIGLNYKNVGRLANFDEGIGDVVKYRIV